VNKLLLETGSVLRNKGRGNQGVAVERAAAITRSFLTDSVTPLLRPKAKLTFYILHKILRLRSYKTYKQMPKIYPKHVQELKADDKNLSETGFYWIWRRGQAMTMHF
jgi:hypothetical protein